MNAPRTNALMLLVGDRIALALTRVISSVKACRSVIRWGRAAAVPRSRTSSSLTFLGAHATSTWPIAVQ